MPTRAFDARPEVLDEEVSGTDSSLSGKRLKDAPAGEPLRPVLQCALPEARTALVGRTRSGEPWGFRLGGDGPAHLFISGPAGCGKSELLRSSIVSLCWSTAPQALGVLAIDPSGRQLGMLDGLPHALLEPVCEAHRAAALLAWLVDEVRQRHHTDGRPKPVVLAVEDLAPWRQDAELRAHLTWLRRFGGQVGIHVLQIASSSAGMEPAGETDTCLARGQRRPGDFMISARDQVLPIRTLWLPIRDLLTCLDEIRQSAWLAGYASARGDAA